MRLPTRDIYIVAGDAYPHVLRFSESQDDYTFSVYLTSDDATPTVIKLTQEWDGTDLNVSLSAVQTASLEGNIWTWIVRRSDDKTFFRGRVIVQ